MAFQAVGSFKDEHGRTIFYDSSGEQSLLPGTFVQQETERDKILAELLISNSPVPLIGNSGKANVVESVTPAPEQPKTPGPVDGVGPMPQTQTSTPAEPASKWTKAQIKDITNSWDEYKNDPSKLRSMMDQYGVGVQDVVDVLNSQGKSIDLIGAAKTLNADTGANGWGGLHFNDLGQLTGTDTKGPLSASEVASQKVDAGGMAKYGSLTPIYAPQSATEGEGLVGGGLEGYYKDVGNKHFVYNPDGSFNEHQSVIIGGNGWTAKMDALGNQIGEGRAPSDQSFGATMSNFVEDLGKSPVLPVVLAVATGGFSSAGTGGASGIAGMLGMNAGAAATAVNTGAMSGLTSLARGNNLETAVKDGLKGAAISGVNSYATDLVKGSDLVKGLDPALQTAIGTTAAGTAMGATGAAINGTNIYDGAVAGFSNGATRAFGDYVGSKVTDNQSLASIISSGTQAALKGDDIVSAVVNTGIDKLTGTPGSGNLIQTIVDPKKKNPTPTPTPTVVPKPTTKPKTPVKTTQSLGYTNGILGNFLSSFQKGSGTLKQIGG